MLGELRIRDLGVIDDARLEVSPGLNVLTGETGAGKTMVVDALTLLLGERADPGAVRAGRTAALVEGRLAVGGDGEVAAALAAAGVADEEGEVVVARQVLAEGRSRAQLQGRMATVAAIAEVVRPLVEVHGQHEFQRLLRPAVQRELLDRFAGDKVLALRAEFGTGWRRLRAVERELAELAARARDRSREAELLRYQLEEIEAAGVRVGELDELDAEAERLTNAESLREAAVLAWQLLEGEEDAGAVGVRLGAAARTVSGPGRHDEALGELAERAAGLAPKDGGIWNTLGVARYRAGDWKRAAEALEKSMELRAGGDAFDWFFLAMAHHQLGRAGEARNWYDRAVTWVGKNSGRLEKDKLVGDELRRFQAEAEALLGPAANP
jgi:DNA repair protein RecN (Recombination protein N)